MVKEHVKTHRLSFSMVLGLFLKQPRQRMWLVAPCFKRGLELKSLFTNIPLTSQSGSKADRVPLEHFFQILEFKATRTGWRGETFIASGYEFILLFATASITFSHQSNSRQQKKSKDCLVHFDRFSFFKHRRLSAFYSGLYIQMVLTDSYQ